MELPVRLHFVLTEKEFGVIIQRLKDCDGDKKRVISHREGGHRL